MRLRYHKVQRDSFYQDYQELRQMFFRDRKIISCLCLIYA